MTASPPESLPAALPAQLLDFLRRTGLAGAGEVPAATALAGGVSSDIWRVDLARGPICVKRALARLRVAQVWEAPIERNRYEYLWFRAAHLAAPGAVPAMLVESGGLFAMQYLDPAQHPVWKELLRQGRADPQFAARVGSALAAIHAATAGRAEIAEVFPTDAIFHAIRLEPYLLATAARHPDLAPRLEGLVARTAMQKKCLVHGDVSPKNILAGPDGPVFVDAECAWYGDPAFDLAFCLNHLLLKCLWAPQAAQDFLLCFVALAGAYAKKVTWEKKEDLEARTASLLPGLLLARVDGKSPVEYLTLDSQKDMVRNAARPLIANPPERLSIVRDAWQKSLR